MKIKILGPHRVRGKEFWRYFIKKILPETVICDIQQFNLHFPETFSLITKKTIILMLDYEYIREMNMNGVGKQMIKLNDRHKRIHNREISCMLFCPYLKDTL